MPWLITYVTVAVGALAILTFTFTRRLRGNFSRLLAIAAAAVLWPLMVVGGLQYVAVRMLAGYLRRGATPAATPVVTAAQPSTISSLDLVDSLTRLAHRIDVTRPA